MIYKLYSAPSIEPVSTADAKEHLRIYSGDFDDDNIVARNIRGIRKGVESELNRALITQTWDLYLDKWPHGDFIRLPFPPLQSISVFEYTDVDGTTANFTDYTIDIVSEPGRAVLDYGYSWPSVTLATVNPIHIRFVAGYGDEASDVPEPIVDAILLRISWLFDGDEDALRASDNLLWQYRNWA